jgi:hypothetical protein
MMIMPGDVQRIESKWFEKLLEEGDIIELREGHKVYADIPKHFAYDNCKGDFSLTHSEAVIGGELSYLAGRYVVYKTSHEGGGVGMGPHDIYPNGHHVFCERLTDRAKVDFYQTGAFTAMITDIAPVGRAERQWAEA